MPTGSAFQAPTSFYRLNLSNLQTTWDTREFITSSALTCGSNVAFCTKSNVPLECTASFYMDTSSSTCVSTCPANTMPQCGSSISGPAVSYGYCNVSCGSGVICLTSSQYASYSASFSCDSGKTASHLKCNPSTLDNKGAFFYGSRTDPPNIDFNFSSSLDNYYLDLWYYTDAVMSPADLTPTTFYIWYSSGLRITRNNVLTSTTYNLVNSAGTNLSSSITMVYGQWHRIAYQVQKNASNWSLTFFYNKYTSNVSVTSTASLTLSSIYFRNSGGINWFGGYYRGLKIWDSTDIPVTLFKSYDQL